MSIEVVDRAGLEELFARGNPVVVDFYADWCQPCHAVAPEVETLASAFAPAVVVVKIDVDSEPGLARDLGIMSIPTIIRFDASGGEVARFVGVAQASRLADELQLGDLRRAG